VNRAPLPKGTVLHCPSEQRSTYPSE